MVLVKVLMLESTSSTRKFQLGRKDRSTYIVQKYDINRTNGAVRRSLHSNVQYLGTLKYFFDRYMLFAGTSVYTTAANKFRSVNPWVNVNLGR